MARAELRWVTETIAKLRVWEDENKGWSNPYYLGAFVELIGHRTIEISLLCKPIKRAHWFAIIKMCKREGIKKILAKRFRQGVEREHWIEVEKWLDIARRS